MLRVILFQKIVIVHFNNTTAFAQYENKLFLMFKEIKF